VASYAWEIANFNFPSMKHYCMLASFKVRILLFCVNKGFLVFLGWIDFWIGQKQNHKFFLPIVVNTIVRPHC